MNRNDPQFLCLCAFLFLTRKSHRSHGIFYCWKWCIVCFCTFFSFFFLNALLLHFVGWCCCMRAQVILVSCLVKHLGGTGIWRMVCATQTRWFAPFRSGIAGGAEGRSVIEINYVCWLFLFVLPTIFWFFCFLRLSFFSSNSSSSEQFSRDNSGFYSSARHDEFIYREWPLGGIH